MMSETPKKPDDNDKPDDLDGFQFPSLHAQEPAVGADDSSSAPRNVSDVSEVNKISGFDELNAAGKPPPSGGQSWLGRHVNAVLIAGFIGAVVLIVGIKLIGRNAPTNGPDQLSSGVDEIPVNVIEARMGRFQDKIEVVGSIKGEREIELRFESEGIIREFNIVEGQKVQRNELIAKLSDTDALLKVKKAKIELERIEKLYRLQGVSWTQVQSSRLDLEVAQSELRKTRLTAPMSGILGDKGVEMGEYVNPQRKVAILVSITNVVVNVGIIEKYIDKVYPGQKVNVSVDAYPGRIFEAKINTIDPVVDPTTRTFNLTAKIPNAESLLLPGMFARAKIITYEADDAISIPNDALVKTQGGYQVFVITKENVAEARDIDVGYVAAEQSQIEGGLVPGDIVVVQKPPELKAGSKVKIIELQK